MKKVKSRDGLACIECDWVGIADEAVWHDLSNFDDDSMCSNQKGSGWWECPECGGVCAPQEN